MDTEPIDEPDVHDAADDAPAPETGLGALGQLAFAIVAVALIVAGVVAVTTGVRWLFT
jgi:hypothetical protein